MNISTPPEEEETISISFSLLQPLWKCVISRKGAGMSPAVDIEQSWKEVLKDEFEKPYMKDLKLFLKEEIKNGFEIYPPNNLIFNALNHTPFNKVQVVIVGQDPYHGPGQAHGLCFSVPEGVKPPPSLLNIFKEIGTDIGPFSTPHGSLSGWADQGVLLLNAILTVRKKQPASHQKKGWELFTDTVLQKLDERDKPLVFILWGKYAQDKGNFLNSRKHLILKAPHPSPFSAHTGFLGCRHFSKANEFLKQSGGTPINWHQFC